MLAVGLFGAPQLGTCIVGLKMKTETSTAQDYYLKQHNVVFQPQIDHFKIICYGSATHKGENGIPAVHTAPPAGLV